MISVNTLDAKNRLSELLRLVEGQGEEVILCRNGKPVAELRAIPDAPDHLKAHPHLHGARFLPGWDEPLFPEGWTSSAEDAER